MVKRLGTFGDVGFLSLGRGKALSAVEGGIILTNRDDLPGASKTDYRGSSTIGSLDVAKLVFKALPYSFFNFPDLFWFPMLLPFLKNRRYFL